MKDLKLHATCQCQECEGNGYLHDDRWNDFYQFCVQWEKQNPPVHPEEPGFNEWSQREDAAQSDWWETRGHPGGCQNWPPEEYPCPDCLGSGFQEINITLEELAKLLGRHEGAPAWLIEALNCGNGVYRP